MALCRHWEPHVAACRASLAQPTITLDICNHYLPRCPAPCLQVIQILIARDKETHQPKGSAYVWYQRRREAELAIKRLNGSATAMPDPSNVQAKPLLVTVAQQSVAPVSDGDPVCARGMGVDGCCA